MEREIKREENLIKKDINQTILEKNQFIREIKSGLGEKIMTQPNKRQRKPSLFKKFLRIFGI